jgi:hypothetical protein
VPVFPHQQGPTGTFPSLSDIKNSVPFSDNGGEFISSAAETGREKESLPFTRSKGRKKNGNGLRASCSSRTKKWRRGS